MQIDFKKFAEDNEISESTAKKILSILYKKGLTAKAFDRVMRRIEMFLKKTAIVDLMNKMPETKVGQLIDEMIAEDNSREQSLSRDVACSEQTLRGFEDLIFGEKKEFAAGDTVEIQIMRTGKRNHPMYGEIKITPEILQDVEKNFKEDKRGIKIAVDENHEPNHKALGRYTELKKKGKDALFAVIELTKKGAELLTEGAYKYFSPEIAFNKKDEETGNIVKNLLIGGAFTNRPFFKAMQPLLASEEEGQAADRHQNNQDGFGSNSNILFFNTSKSMKTILDLIAKFCEQEKINATEKAELETAFKELKDEDRTPDLTAAVDELLAKFSEEDGNDEGSDDEGSEDKGTEDPASQNNEDGSAEDPKEDPKADPKEDPKADPKEDPKAEDPKETKVEANEKGEVVLKASEYENLKSLASQTSKLVREARKSALDKTVSGLCFSETNKKGVVLPKQKQEIVDFALSLSEKQSDKFFEIISKFSNVYAGEAGHDGSGTEAKAEDGESIKFFSEKLGLTEEQAKQALENTKAMASK